MIIRMWLFMFLLVKVGGVSAANVVNMKQGLEGTQASGDPKKADAPSTQFRAVVHDGSLEVNNDVNMPPSKNGQKKKRIMRREPKDATLALHASDRGPELGQSDDDFEDTTGALLDAHDGAFESSQAEQEDEGEEDEGEEGKGEEDEGEEHGDAQEALDEAAGEEDEAGVAGGRRRRRRRRRKAKLCTTNQASECPHLGGSLGYNRSTCKDKMKALSGDTFNFKKVANGNYACYVKKCESNGLKLVDLSGWQVYSTFCQAASQPARCSSPAGKHATCQHIGGQGSGYTVSTCTYEMTSLGGDTFNYKNGACYVKICGSADMQYSSEHGEFEVYSRYCSNNQALDPTEACKDDPTHAGLTDKDVIEGRNGASYTPVAGISSWCTHVMGNGCSNALSSHVAACNRTCGMCPDQATCASYTCKTKGWNKKTGVDATNYPDDAKCCEAWSAADGYVFEDYKWCRDYDYRGTGGKVDDSDLIDKEHAKTQCDMDDDCAGIALWFCDPDSDKFGTRWTLCGKEGGYDYSKWGFSVDTTGGHQCVWKKKKSAEAS